jgi:S-adenosylmethionine decarboxylase
MPNYRRPQLGHYIVEVFGLGEIALANTSLVQAYAKEFIRQSKLHVVYELRHDFQPNGTSLVFILSTSHLVVHTWPEVNYLHLDLISCDTSLNESGIDSAIRKVFGTSGYRIIQVNYDPIPIR